MKHHSTKRKAGHKPAPFLQPDEQKSWAQRLKLLLLRIRREIKAPLGLHQANHETVQRTLRGMGPDSDAARPEYGAHMVVNISSAHIPAFCRSGYMNAYDLESEAGMKGGRPPDAPRVSDRRRRVDQALPLGSGVAAKDVYFGAVELTGAGMHFYGDICLVLNAEAVDVNTVVLDRNSFDVDRSPAVDRIGQQLPGAQAAARASLLSSWSGRWGDDLATMTTVRMHAIGVPAARRWTTGHVARVLVDDEDYLEVLKHGRFGAADIQEARLFAEDVAHEAHITSRLGKIPTPRFEELIWRRRRMKAEVTLRGAGIPVRVVTHAGRGKG
ncbi:hypothetical protein [Chromobacterium subtsugae]|uniref:hypothetical protein n=1 Tax=Chromobacterium subtsugae TaxID=251747 RepID=UPI0006415E66|nr:hypothetical protein [Chromobacterium subtsugae]